MDLTRGGFVDLTLSGFPEGPTIFLANGFFPSEPFPIAGPRVDLTEECFEYHYEGMSGLVGAVVLLSLPHPKAIFESILSIIHAGQETTTQHPDPSPPTRNNTVGVCDRREILHVCDIILTRQSGYNSLVSDVRKSQPWNNLQLFHREMMGELEFCK